VGILKNNFEIREDSAVIFIERLNGNKLEIDRTLIDKEDFERMFNNGYTWFSFQGNGQPYAVCSIKKKRIYLHRFIMNTPNNMVVDHINHDTLDNRKSNLNNVSIYENQQNRLGSRKGSKSGVRVFHGMQKIKIGLWS
jgi:hypothetical protein